jgi:hypothetical protein
LIENGIIPLQISPAIADVPPHPRIETLQIILERRGREEIVTYIFPEGGEPQTVSARAEGGSELLAYVLEGGDVPVPLPGKVGDQSFRAGGTVGRGGNDVHILRTHGSPSAEEKVFPDSAERERRTAPEIKGGNAHDIFPGHEDETTKGGVRSERLPPGGKPVPG